MRAEVLIVGGGLSGLHTAYELERRGVNVVLAEARDRLGGRILSRNFNSAPYVADRAAFDLGPAWFWPGQSRMQALVAELDLTSAVFAQAEQGDSLYEDAQGAIQRGLSGISMEGAYRLKGGMRQIVAKLAQRISHATILHNACVTHVRRREEKIISTLLIEGSAQEVISNFVVFALPPRLTIATIRFEPELSPARGLELSAITTWMAGHAKIVAFYCDPFWREQGLSGDAISHRGPLHEIHDASPNSGGPYALFGFVSEPAKWRQQQLRAAATDQLQRLFGAAAATPLDVYQKDWASDPYTSTEEDQKVMAFHPVNDLINLTESSWDKRIIWSGTETAGHHQHNNGYLEGALEASLRTVAILDRGINN